MDQFTFQHQDGVTFQLTPRMIEEFQKSGCLLIRGLFSAEEMRHLNDCFASKDFQSKVFTRGTGKDSGFQMSLWWEPGDDTCGLITRSHRLVNTFRILLGGAELYHLSSKLVMKAPKSGGLFSWHQDYGYFYENGVPTPQCGSISLPLDRCYCENGALQVIPGSHLLGRQTHTRTGDLAGVAEERMEEITSSLGQPVVCETNPGDCLFFHSNLLHSSGPNLSPDKRRNLVLAYNQVTNAPLSSNFLREPKPLIVVEDEMVLTQARDTSSTDKCYTGVREDTSTEHLTTRDTDTEAGEILTHSGMEP